MGTETRETGLLRYVYDDGGRSAAGFQGTTGDCVTRALAIATGIPYADAYAEVADLQHRAGKARTARTFRLGRRAIDELLAGHGFEWTPTMKIGAGCTVHLNREVYEHAFGGLVYGAPLIVRCSAHLVAVVNGQIRDTYDPSRDGTRCVYGYWKAAA